MKGETAFRMLVQMERIEAEVPSCSIGSAARCLLTGEFEATVEPPRGKGVGGGPAEAMSLVESGNLSPDAIDRVHAA